MSLEDVILVATVREEIRGGALRVHVADIPRYMAKAEVQQAKLEAETRAKADAEAKAKAESDDNAREAEAQKAKLKAGAKAKAEAEAKAKREVDLKAKAEAREAKLWAEVEAREKAEAEARENREAEAIDAKVTEEAKVKAAEEAKAAATMAELEVKKRVEKERLEIEVKSNTEAAKAKAEGEEERKRVKAELRAKEQIARQRAADKAARAAAGAASTSSPMSPVWGSSGGGWLKKIASVASAMEEPAFPKSAPSKSISLWNTDPWSRHHVKNTPSPSTELGPLRGPDGPGAPVQHSSTTSSPPRGSVSTHPATSITAALLSTSMVYSSPTHWPVWKESKLTNDKQDGKWFWLTTLYFGPPFLRHSWRSQDGSA
jgi:hypothetical protein